MPAITRALQSIPPGAPVYYLGRPADWWLTALCPARPASGPPRRGLTKGGEPE